MDTATETSEETISGASTNEGDGEATQSTAEAKPLVLPSLEIKNFRAFKHLTVEKLGRVNLITGLEALWLLAEQDTPQALKALLLDRNEIILTQHEVVKSREGSFEDKNELNNELVRMLSSLFYKNGVNEEKQTASIGSVGKN